MFGPSGLEHNTTFTMEKKMQRKNLLTLQLILFLFCDRDNMHSLLRKRASLSPLTKNVMCCTVRRTFATKAPPIFRYQVKYDERWLGRG